jgi:hypothetical protein
MSEMNTILGPVNLNPSTTSASVLLPTMQAINGVFGRLDKVAPGAVSADMANLSSFWNQVVADFNDGSTLAQVRAYIKAHPPSNASTVTGSVQQLKAYLSTTCHINMSS